MKTVENFHSKFVHGKNWCNIPNVLDLKNNTVNNDDTDDKKIIISNLFE